METPKKEQKPSVKTSYEAFALYDVVRGAIFENYRQGQAYLNEVNKFEARGVKLSKNDYRVVDFKAKVIDLYIDIKDKLTYPRYPDRFKELKELDYFLEGNLGKLELSKAKHYFMIERTFLEVDGITKFEREKDDIPKEYVMAKLSKGLIHGAAADSPATHKQDD